MTKTGRLTFDFSFISVIGAKIDRNYYELTMKSRGRKNNFILVEQLYSRLK